MNMPVQAETTGTILWRGPSLLTGDPIVAIATWRSRNTKTSNMIQVWILRSDMHPDDARNTGADRAICGDCLHRNTSCFVTPMAPAAVYRSFRAGRYNSHDETGFVMRRVRLSAYGDPAAVPFETWEHITDLAERTTGYTHQWRTCDQRLAQITMASCDSEQDVIDARAMGWRTFRVRLPDEPLLPCERACPASAEAGKRTTCFRCCACGGLKHRHEDSYTIIVHGGRRNAFRSSAAHH